MQTQVKSLADATLHKQSQVELLRGENKALLLQLEQERQRTFEAQRMVQNFASKGRNRERDLEGGKSRSIQWCPDLRFIAYNSVDASS